MARSAGGSRDKGQLRIIGGQWRGRKLQFTAAAGLRPTSDRIRETLFNWLAPQIHGARCLDLYAGSGALGLEALSRGAAYCDFVELASATGRELDQQLRLLNAQSLGRVHTMAAAQFIAQFQAQSQAQYDIIFLDPPFGAGLIAACAEQLQQAALLAPNGFVYVETEINAGGNQLPPSWQAYRDKSAGNVRYQLFTEDGSA